MILLRTLRVAVGMRLSASTGDSHLLRTSSHPAPEEGESGLKERIELDLEVEMDLYRG